MPAANLIGQTFGYLVVQKRVENKYGHAMWECKCRCGNIVISSTGDLNKGKTKSCGCWRKEYSKNNYIDETGNIYGRLTVLSRAGTNKDGKALWLCKCVCGNTTIVTGKSLRTGATKSCGCYMRDVVSEKSLHDLTGMRFGMLTVIKRAKTKYSKAGNQNTQWLCKCDCGNYSIVSANSLVHNQHTRSCGCAKSSYREKEIDNILKHMHIKHTIEYIFEDLISPNGHPLRFDFALLDNEDNIICLIEHQGQQHYEKYSNGFGDFQREVTDKIKKDFCKTNNIPLFEIKYDEDIINSIRKILSQINVSYVNSVPSTQEIV